MTDIEVQRLVSAHEFVKAWFTMLPNYPTYEAAYEALEIIYIGYYRRRRYSDYNSFRVVKTRIYKRK